METTKTRKRERELERSRGGLTRNMLLIISAVIVAAVAVPLIILNAASPNNQPVIASLEAEPERVLPSGSSQITCSATDPDGDALAYEWTASGGDISGAGEIVTWTAPQEFGTYNVTVVVDDGRGGEATSTMVLTASDAPVIESLNVTAREPKYLKTTATGYKVGKTKVYDIEVIASGTGVLSYDWTYTGGEISGEGAVVTWTAPDTTSDVTVTVRVYDGEGNWAEKGIVLKVVDCSPCTFG
jgi:Bacterial Ig domain